MGDYPGSGKNETKQNSIEAFKDKRSIIIELWDRRVFHIIGIYLGGSWAMLEFVSSFLVDRFYMSEQWISISFVLLISLIPSVLMVAWFHGRPGPDTWNKIEKIGIPINLAITVALLLGIYGGKDLNARTEEMRVLNERGEAVIKTVPKSEYKKGIAIVFNQSSTDTGIVINALDMVVAEMLYHDLRQELFFSVQDPWNQQIRFRQEGSESDDQVMPLTLIREHCKQQFLSYFIIPSLTFSNDMYHLKIRLYDADRLHLLLEYESSSELPFSPIDLATRKIKTALKISEKHIDESTDLPVAELMTADMEALMAYIKAMEAHLLLHDYALATTHINNALEVDAYFAQAMLRQVLIYMLSLIHI